SPPPFPAAPPVSSPRVMALAEETKRIIAQLEYTDEDANRGVAEFIRQMGKLSLRVEFGFATDGLTEKEFVRGGAREVGNQSQPDPHLRHRGAKRHREGESPPAPPLLRPGTAS